MAVLAMQHPAPTNDVGLSLLLLLLLPLSLAGPAQPKPLLGL
jgi:hypothetical protein